MQGTCVEALPSLKIPNNLVAQRATNSSRNETALLSGSLSLASTPETPSAQLPKVTKYPRGVKRINGYVHKSFAYGSPELVKKLFTGTLTPTYFNDICYGRRDTPQEYRYSTPIERTKELWEPKHVSREKTRHVVREIQDARFRKQNLLEKASVKKERERVRKTEAALLREADLVTRGVAAYQTKMDRQKQKYDAILTARKQKRKPTID